MKSSTDIMNELIRDCLNEMYIRSYPSITLDELEKKSRENPDEQLFKQHYIPKFLYEEIVEYYVEDMVSKHYTDRALFLKDCLINGYYKKTYKNNERTYEQTPTLEQILGDKEQAEKVEKLFDEIIKEHDRDHDVEVFRFNVMNYSPCSNKETVIKYLKSQGQDVDESMFDDDKFTSIWDEDAECDCCIE